MVPSSINFSNPVAAPKVEFTTNPQDRSVMSAGTIQIDQVTIDPKRHRVSTPSVALMGPLQPNHDGSYLYDESKPAEFTASIAFSAVAHTVALTEKHWGEKIHWATERDQLQVTPDAGEDLNAYYARQRGGTFYFHATDPVTQQVVYSGRSGEVTGHESGHAILDAKRPNYLGSWSPDPGAFHESFSDCLALAVALQDERVLDVVMQQTGGDLSRQNVAASLGEELGTAINHTAGKNVTGGDYTRNAINNFTWKDPSTLPSSAPHDQLSRQVHSYSRLWTGAMYDVLRGIVDQSREAGMDARSALRYGGEELHKMLGRLLRDGQAPDGDFAYRDMARALIRSEAELNGGKYAGLIERVMTAREILPQGRAMLEEPPLPSGTREVTVTLKGDRFGSFQGVQVSARLSGDTSRSFLEDLGDREKVSNDIAALIEQGDILMTEPNQDPTRVHLFKPDGEPYRGVVRWVDSQPILEPTYIAGL